ncbi:hypothetical protein Belba_3483 [Belliella baltica DSM 15883]|uniref:Gram-negative bacterial tonB protein n=1 Tax=Belliella baltica (strain DSM 15883 / CIP 108006 / LMG 21964 / BA134) TaxID=866536 RepID=I3Z9R6_BELBD|nr:hypothetical protein [Belliella baltica]AFL85984.1 hypothetical protein Belba_3483 [Belliella baltica DSM 15883]
MKNLKFFVSLLVTFILSYGQVTIASGLQLSNGDENEVVTANAVDFKSVTLKKLNSTDTYTLEINKIESENEPTDFGSPWAWPEFTLEMVDSYTPFIFRTKNSAALDEVRLVLNVNDKGKLVGYEFLTEADRGLEQRIAHVLRKLPKCLPVPGYDTYGATDFELIIKR